MKQTLRTAVLYTVVTGLVLGLGYPLAITGIAHILFPKQANGSLVVQGGELRGSRLIGQPFHEARYFHGRPSAAGTGYDAGASSGSNLGPTSKALVDRVQAGVTAEAVGTQPVPEDLVTASGSGLDPDITPAAAMYQVPRVARARQMTEPALAELVQAHIVQRQMGLFGEPRVNVLALNMELDAVTR